MQVKHNHLCMLTNKMTTCFVFSEFAMLFSLSRDAYEQFWEDYPFYPESENFCSFCDTNGLVKKVTGFDNTTFFSDLYLCHKCATKLKDKIEENY